MLIDELEARVRNELPPGARVGARVRAAEVLGGHAVEVVCRVNRQGRPVVDYFCDGTRMERPTLLKLLCSETACPEAMAVRRRWRSFTGLAEKTAAARVVPLRPAPLIEEVAVDGAGHHCVLRPASFECLTPCPTGAHAPRLLRKPGWDLFEDGVWLAGGLIFDRDGSASWPRFESPGDAQRWLARQQAASSAWLTRCR